MKKQIVMAASLALALGMPLVGCGGQQQAAQPAQQQSSKSDSKAFDAEKFYVGQWRGSVEITGQTVYGTAGGNEQMLDVNLEEGGKCNVKPLEAHADLLTDEGTWEGTEDELTLHLSKGDIKLKVSGSAALEGKASDFGIADFDTIKFDFYG